MTAFSDPAVGNLIQIVLIVVTLVGLGVALLNGKKDRDVAIKLARDDRRSADERAQDDRQEAVKATEDERAYTREQAQLQMQLDHTLKLVHLANSHRGNDLPSIRHWSLSMKASILVLGEEFVPIAWSVFFGNNDHPRWNESREEIRREVDELAIQTARSLNCPSCFHVHRMN